MANPTLDEGILTAVRQNSVGNKFLRQRSLASGLATAILPALFRPSGWFPLEAEDGVALSSDDGMVVQRSVHRKALCDVAEASLGVAWLSGGLAMAMEVGDKLGMCFGGTTPWAERVAFESLRGSLPPAPRLPA